MEKITKEQQDAIKKASSENLRDKLLRAGWETEKVGSLDRSQLLEAAAELAAQQATAAEANAHAKELNELKRRELAMREEELAISRKKDERKAEEFAMRKAELKIQQEAMAAKQKNEGSLAERTRKIAGAVKHVLVKMSDEPAEAPMFFEGLENLYEMYDVPPDIQSKLLLPLLNSKARMVISRMTVAELDSYATVKKRVLAELKLTPREYLLQFKQARKQSDETFTLFKARLSNLLNYYVSSRNADKDIVKLFDLIVSDRLKEALPSSALNYVLSLEGDSTFESSKVAATADIFVNNSPSSNEDDGRYKHVSRPYSQSVTVSRGGYNQTAATRGNSNWGLGRGVASKQRLCYICKSDKHLQADCNQKKSGGAARVNTCISLETPLIAKTAAVGDPGERQVQAGDNTKANGRDVMAARPKPKPRLSIAAQTVENSNGTDKHSVLALNVADRSNVQVRVVPLKYTQLYINNQPVKTLIDSGSQVAILNGKILDGTELQTVGTIQVQGVFGEPQTANIVSVEVRRCNEDAAMNGVSIVSAPTQIVCAVVPSMAAGHDMILPPELADEILQSPLFEMLLTDRDDRESIYSTFDCGDENDDCCEDDVSETDNVTNNECVYVDIDEDVICCNTMSTQGTSGVAALIDEQSQDTSLTSCHKLAAIGKGGYEYQNGILYHRESVLGQHVLQLVVPSGRRKHVLEIAHAGVAYHLGVRKTMDRIRLSFWWIGIKAQVADYVATCSECQLKSRLRTTDRVPITPIPRAELPFQMMNMDCIGPIEPPGGPQKYRYCLCIQDSFSRWPSVFMLRSITAKATCQALIELFATTGVPTVIWSDLGSNFNCALTKEFLKRMGCAPRFNSPLHPQSSGAVERLNGSFKNMLHHAIRENGTDWPKVVPFLVWSLRETPSETTGVAPYMCVYGFLPSGPLNLLKKNWAGECDLPPGFGKSATQYMQELKQSMEIVAGYAADHSAKAQAKYAYYHNLRSKDKHFQVGDQVIVLTPDSTHSKVYARWVGPATVAEVKSPYSYLIDMPDGSRRHFHANKLRRFLVRAQTCGVLDDSDREFGEISTAPSMVSETRKPSERIDPQKLEHLKPGQRRELIEVLDRYPECFDEKPGFCDVVQHEIKLKPGFQPKPSRAYRIPEILKPTVEKQIDELVRDGFLVPSKSPVSSPIVCVLKPNKKDIRIACDYRIVNSGSEDDAYPMPTVDEVFNKVGHARFISVFDARSGYWQCPVKPEDRWLTAIVTPSGLWEWTRVPFGLKGSGATFVRMVQEILRPIREFSSSYIDDMAVHSDAWKPHLQHVRRFLQTIKESGLTLNLHKCEFAKAEVKFVGQYIGSGKRRPDPEKLVAIHKLCRPITRKQLRSVLGLFGYYRPYLEGFAELAKPLTDLTSKKGPVTLPWSEREQTAFDAIKTKLCEITELAIPKIGQPFSLYTDASGIAVGACLTQSDGSGREQPIAYGSQKLTDTQTRWSTIEREAYAVIFALQRWHDIIFGAQLTMWCDHNPLTYIVACAPKSARLTRWALALQQYNLVLRYKRGSENLAADCLSRL